LIFVWHILLASCVACFIEQFAVDSVQATVFTGEIYFHEASNIKMVQSLSNHIFYLHVHRGSLWDCAPRDMLARNARNQCSSFQFKVDVCLLRQFSV
jgi:hypothetical protein